VTYTRPWTVAREHPVAVGVVVGVIAVQVAWMVGARVCPRMSMTECVVTAIALVATASALVYNDTTTWRYRFEPTGDDDTVVTEGYEFTAPWWLQTMDTVLGRPRALRSGVHRTLANLKRAAECAASAP
jgi:hypothetical protein